MPQGIKTCQNLKDQVPVLQVLRQDSKGRRSCVHSYRKCAMTEDTGAVGRLILTPTRYWVWCCSLWHGPPTPLRALLWLSRDGVSRAQPQGPALQQQECSCPSWAQHSYSFFHLNTGLVHRWWSISSPRDLSLWWWVHRYLVPRMQLCPWQGVGRLFKSIQISHAAQHSFYVIKWWKFSTKTKWVLMYHVRSHVWNHFMTSSLPALSGRARAEATRHSEALSAGRQRYRRPRPPLLVHVPVSPTEEQYHHHSPCPALLQARTCANAGSQPTLSALTGARTAAKTAPAFLWEHQQDHVSFLLVPSLLPHVGGKSLHLMNADGTSWYMQRDPAEGPCGIPRDAWLESNRHCIW